MSQVILAKSGEALKAGPIGLAVILLLCIACYFLFKSMSKHLGEVRENFPSDEPAAPPAARAKPGTVRPVDGTGTERATPAIAPVIRRSLPQDPVPQDPVPRDPVPPDQQTG